MNSMVTQYCKPLKLEAIDYIFDMCIVTQKIKMKVLN